MGKSKTKLIKAGLLFFVIMVGLTVISRAAFGVTAVQVKTMLPSSGKITHTLTSSGELKGKRELAVSVPEGIAVEQVCVSPGAAVGKGTTLLILQAESLKQAIDSCKADSKATPEEEVRAETDQLRRNSLLSIESNGGRVVAPGGGLITEVNVKAGDKTTGGGDIRYADSSQGLLLTAEFNKEDRNYLKKGAKITVTGDNDKTVSGLRIKYIAPHQEDPEMINVTAEVPGKKLKIGQSADMMAESVSSLYNSCIPREALHQESGGYYVYVIKEQETVIGDQLVARQMPVEFQDRDETLAAVDGLMGEDEIIIEADKELEDGARVRRIEP